MYVSNEENLVEVIILAIQGLSVKTAAIDFFIEFQ